MRASSAGSTAEQLARKIARKSQVTASQPGQSLPGTLGTVKAVNGDGTATVTYLGADIPCQLLGNFVPVVGQGVLVLIEGERNWAIGPTKMTGLIPVFGIQGSATLPVPSPLGGLFLIVGYVEGETDSSSELEVDFDVPFPAACIGVVCQPVYNAGVTDEFISSIVTLLPTATGFKVIAYFGDTGVASAVIGFSFIAFGV